MSLLFFFVLFFILWLAYEECYWRQIVCQLVTPLRQSVECEFVKEMVKF